MALRYNPKIITDNLVLNLDPSHNKSYPTDLPVKDGLILWLDAADDSTFSYSSGTAVSQWRDKSGLNNHVAQSTVANQPSRSTIQNSRKSVLFDGGDTLFNSGNVFPSISTDYTKIAVVYQTSTGTTGNVISSWTYTVGRGHAFYFANTNLIRLWHDGDFVTSSTALNTNTLGIISGTYINSTGAGAIYVNGTASGTGTATNRNINQDISIGSFNGNSSNFTGQICEVLVFSKALSANELKRIHTYLGQKWGISNTDRSIIDLSGNSNDGLSGNGTVANMPTVDYYNKGSFRFDGSNDFIKVGTNSSLQVNNVTIAAFFKTVNNGQSVQFIAGYGDTGLAGYWIGMTSGPIRFSIGGGSGNYLQLNSGITPNNDQIYYVVGTYDGTNQRIYIDGALQASATTVTGNISYTGLTDGFLLGQVQGFTAGRYLTGYIYNVQVYNRALNAAEILANYEAQKNRFTNSIVHQGLILNLDAGNPYSYAGAGSTIYDVSPTALSWTINNATYNSDPIKYLSYNGSNCWLQSSTSSVFDTQTLTMECWCYPSTLAQNGFLFEKGQVNTQYSMFFNSTSVFYFRTIGGTINNQDLTIAASSYITVNAWNHIVCTYNGSAKIIYVNGAQVASVSASGTINTGQTNQYIGKYGDAGNSYPFNGRIAESRVYNIALSAAQVLQNYNATKARFGL